MALTKKKLVLTSVLVLLFLAVTGTQSVFLSKANPYILKVGKPPDEARIPEIVLSSPTNNTFCTPDNVSLSFHVSTGDLFLSKVYYEADWQEETTYVYQYTSPDPSNPPQPIHEFFYSQNIKGIPEGEHTVIITAREWGSYIEGMFSVEFSMNASCLVNFAIDGVSPKILFLTLENKTYTTSDIPLNFAVNEQVSKISYVLDGLANVTAEGNTTLNGLVNGYHSLTVYATDEAGNVGASETVYFTVDVPFPTTLVITASGASVAVVGLGLLVYFKKRKRNNEPKIG